MQILVFHSVIVMHCVDTSCTGEEGAEVCTTTASGVFS
ncbi:hypothetical protein ANAPC4_00723 [Anaplasma phagocytophilum]|nr:hypothetical protein ANAPC4_00723 [Anaplasma phagocytophilum]